MSATPYFQPLSEGYAVLHIPVGSCRCDEEHRRGCRLVDALTLLPADAVSVGIEYNTEDDVITFEWETPEDVPAA